MGGSQQKKPIFAPVVFGSESSSSRDVEDPRHVKPSRFAFLFGGKSYQIGPRVVPVPDSLKNDVIYQGDDSGAAILEKQLAAEQDQAIKYRTCSWQKAAGLLFSEYISLAVMNFPAAYAVLGLVPGIFLTVLIAAITLYTSLVLWELCLRHPEIHDVCGLGQMILWNKKWAWWATTVMFVLNSVFVQGVHILVGTQYLNIMTESSTIRGCRSVELAIVFTIAGWLVSLPRTFDILSKIGAASAFFAFVSLLLAVVFVTVQGHPPGYDPVASGEPLVTAWPVKGTTFAQLVSASLAISFTFFGQIALPSFIAEMRDPRDFPKALWACTIAETITFTVVGVVMYVYVGKQYIYPLAFWSLRNLYKKISFSFLVPTVLFLGSLYASVTTRFIFFRIFRDTRHVQNHTVVGWASWAGILFAIWVSAFLVSQVVPFFASLLSVTSSLFNSWFGLMFWGIGFYRMRSTDKNMGRRRGRMSDYMLQVTNISIIAIGMFFLSAGSYASVKSIVREFAAGTVRGVFQCTSDKI